MSDGSALDERSRKIIKSVVDEYMHSGSPVSSSTIAAKEGINLSPASVRYVMASLEEMGLLEHVHTSSGRKPTASGLQVYLHSLISMRNPTKKERDGISENLRTDSANSMAKSAMETLASMTRLISLVSLPSTTESKLRQIQLVRCSSSRAMAILVTMEGEVRNRLVEIDAGVTQRDLETAAEMFNERFHGHTLGSARLELRGLVMSLKEGIAQVLERMVESISEGPRADGRKVYIAGQERLFANTKLLSDAERLREMANLLLKKEQLLELLDKGSVSPDVSIFIGSDSGVSELEGFSMVTTPYEDSDGNVVGALGVVGPVRMRYASVVPIIELTSSLMGEAMVKIKEGLN